MGDTKSPCKRWQATVEFPGVRISQIWDDKTLERLAFAGTVLTY